MVIYVVESRRKHLQQIKRAKKPFVKWYMLKVVFWSLLVVTCFVFFMLGWVVGKYF